MDNTPDSFYKSRPLTYFVKQTSIMAIISSQTTLASVSREQSGKENITTPMIDFGTDKKILKVH
jgi:hypothetical protein